jgi:hypothetical protein
MTATTIDDARPRARSLAIPHPELLGLLVVAAALNLWGLSQNGFANTYYAGAVRSMASSWHAFLYGSLDPTGLMTSTAAARYGCRRCRRAFIHSQAC